MTYEQNSMRGRESSFGRTREDLGAAADQVRQQTQQKLDDGREQAAGGLDSLVSAASAAAEDLREHNQQGLSRYVNEIADSVASVASSLRNKSVDELVHEVEAIARKNPTLFLAGSLAVGLGIGRFARASTKPRFSDKGVSDKGASDKGLSDKDQGAGDFSGSNFSDEDYPRNISGDAYPEKAGSYTSSRVTEEDYLADDFTAAGGAESDLESSSDLGNRNRIGGDDPSSVRDTLITRRDSLAGRSESTKEIPTKQTSRQCRPGSGNQPIVGDFYE